MFDSGVGGLSVLAALRRALPEVPLHYLADAAHAPYGERSSAYVGERAVRIVAHLEACGARLIVVACNTATALVIDALRASENALPLVGVEPGVKPAAAASAARRMAVLATPGTLASPRFASLIARTAGDCAVVPVPCPGLAAAIEQGDAGSAQVDALLDTYCAAVRTSGADVAVLGCTHYPLVASHIAERLGPGIALIDTAPAVARQVRARWSELALPAAASPALAPITLQSTGDVTVLARLAMAHVAGAPREAQRVLV